MAKVTKSDLEKLIEGVLSERLPIKDITSMSTVDAKAELGLRPGDSPSLALIKAIAAKEAPGDDLTEKDFESVFNTTGRNEGSRKKAEAALAIFLNTNIDQGVRDVVFNAFSGSKYNKSKPAANKPRKALVDARVTGKQDISDRVKIFCKF